jgi:penicillin amidase
VNLTFSCDLKALPLKSESKIVVDERGVTHIFGANDHDLYFLQGFLTAKDRLWQMEFQTHAAGGRISEIVGDKAIHFDLEQRRMGMVASAQAALDAFDSDTLYRNVVQSYTNGVNAYIGSLNRDNLPFEYRLLDYEPEPWTPLKSSLLLKYMAKMLTGTERDRENTALVELLGQNLFRELYPEQNLLSDPVIPAPYELSNSNLDSVKNLISLGPAPVNDNRSPKNIGSNNWAVSGERTESGLPILCNDPHLRLSLPSIWYEIQLNAPGINCYGVSLPGSPGITLGFNKDVAWGVTNAGRDVRDYYRVEYRDESKSEYKSGETRNPSLIPFDLLNSVR